MLQVGLTNAPNGDALLRWRLDVAVQAPAHSALGDTLSYASAQPHPPGTLVRVPLGRREVLGVVWAVSTLQRDADGAAPLAARPGPLAPPPQAAQANELVLKPLAAALDALPPLSAGWRDLVAFAARYYQRALGEVALAALPPQLRELSDVQLARRLKRHAAAPETAAGLATAIAPASAPAVAPRPAPTDAARASGAGKPGSTGAAATRTAAATAGTTPPPAHASLALDAIALSAEQAGALARFGAETGPFLLFGSTGSGKTEVYLRAVATLLASDTQAQALVMVPEINLTPQLEARFRERFEPTFGAGAVVSLHSGMTNPQRLASWLAAHSGQARIVLGTRMAVFASMPTLRLIVVDEEHDPSYKQQEGARYSARDLAVWRGQRERAKVMLGSATPSLESWHQSRPPEGDAPGGRYLRLTMPSRIGAVAGPRDAGAGGAPTAPGIATSTSSASAPTPGPASAPGTAGPPAGSPQGALPTVRLVDMNLQPPRTVLSGALLDAIGQRIARGEQSMVFLNRRGYAPVLACNACDWKSECPHCSAFRVFHKIDRTLRCHHCGFTERVPRACPACGNPDIAPVGRGTERLEEHLGELFAAVPRPDGSPVRIARIDADSTRKQGALAQQLAQVHSGEVDVLVGTQMIAKGHDFRRITLVAAINPDGALFSSDFRAPERLFSLLMQSAGRAGRDAAYLAAQGSAAEMWIQTFHPHHPLFTALRRHDYPAFAADQLAERRAASMPPFAFQALVRADARTQEAAQLFLNTASAAAEDVAHAAHVTRYPAVPLTIQRVANVERAQMLIESPSRAALQRFLHGWQPVLHALRRTPEGKGVIRWLVDVDPQAI